MAAVGEGVAVGAGEGECEGEAGWPVVPPQAASRVATASAAAARAGLRLHPVMGMSIASPVLQDPVRLSPSIPVYFRRPDGCQPEPVTPGRLSPAGGPEAA
jgi:hypothetical protein